MKTAAHGRRRRRCSSLAARASRESYYYRVVCKRRGSFMRRRPSKVGWLLIVERISRTPVHCTRSPRPRNFYPKLFRTASPHRAYPISSLRSSFRRFSTGSSSTPIPTTFWDRIISPIRLGIDKLPGGLFPGFPVLRGGLIFTWCTIGMITRVFGLAC